MAWGYEKSFTIEHDNTLKKRIDCRDCCYYDTEDKSCMKRPLYLPIDGYNLWRSCRYFELSQEVCHYSEKQSQLEHLEKRRELQARGVRRTEEDTGIGRETGLTEEESRAERGLMSDQASDIRQVQSTAKMLYQCRENCQKESIFIVDGFGSK